MNQDQINKLLDFVWELRTRGATLRDQSTRIPVEKTEFFAFVELRVRQLLEGGSI